MRTVTTSQQRLHVYHRARPRAAACSPNPAPATRLPVNHRRSRSSWRNRVNVPTGFVGDLLSVGDFEDGHPVPEAAVFAAAEGYVPVKGGALLQEPFRLERFGVIVELRLC